MIFVWWLLFFFLLWVILSVFLRPRIQKTFVPFLLKNYPQIQNTNIIEQLNFGNKLAFGTSTAAWQVEKISNPSNWSYWEKQLNSKNLPFVPPQGEGCCHFENFEEDVKLMKKMNMTCYRFSFSWSDIQPSKETFNPDAIQRYKKMINILNENNIKPLITLHHFEHPQWIEEEGGVLCPNFVNYYKDYVSYVMKHFKYNEYWFTVNEPNIFSFLTYLFHQFPCKETTFNIFGLGNIGLSDFARIQSNIPKLIQIMFKIFFVYKIILFSIPKDIINYLFPKADLMEDVVSISYFFFALSALIFYVAFIIYCINKYYTKIPKLVFLIYFLFSNIITLVFSFMFNYFYSLYGVEFCLFTIIYCALLVFHIAYLVYGINSYFQSPNKYFFYTYGIFANAITLAFAYMFHTSDSLNRIQSFVHILGISLSLIFRILSVLYFVFLVLNCLMYIFTLYIDLSNSLNSLLTLMKCHQEGYTIIHDNNPEARVSFANHIQPFWPEHKYSIFETIVAYIFNLFNTLVLTCVDKGYFKILWKNYKVSDEPLGLDFIGINHYNGQWITYSSNHWDIGFLRSMQSNIYELSETKWCITYDSLAKTVRWINEQWNPNNKDIIISENGIADNTDKQRRVHLQLTLYYLKQEMEKYDIPVKMYLHWSLLDNYEWADGYTKHFGLINIIPDEIGNIKRSNQANTEKDQVVGKYESIPRQSAEIYMKIASMAKNPLE